MWYRKKYIGNYLVKFNNQLRLQINLLAKYKITFLMWQLLSLIEEVTYSKCSATIKY